MPSELVFGDSAYISGGPKRIDLCDPHSLTLVIFCRKRSYQLLRHHGVRPRIRPMCLKLLLITAT